MAKKSINKFINKHSVYNIDYDNEQVIIDCDIHKIQNININFIIVLGLLIPRLLTLSMKTMKRENITLNFKFNYLYRILLSMSITIH